MPTPPEGPGMARSYKYEVIADVSGKPQIDRILDSDEEAVERAQYLLAQAKFTAVRVVRIDRIGTEKVIFEKAYSGGGKQTSISHIDEANYCATAHDVYVYESRRTLVRLMRMFCDEQVKIPTQLLHDALILRHLEKEFLLYNQVIHRVGTLQARKRRTRPEDRYEELEKIYKVLFENAKAAEQLAPYFTHLVDHGPSSLHAHVEATIAAQDRARVLNYAFARYLEPAADWGDKLTSLCELFEHRPDDVGTALLDEVIAEIVDGSAPMKALIGYAPDLATAITALAALAKGELDERFAGTPPLRRLNDVIRLYRLPLTTDVILGRIAKSLAGTGPLTRLDRAADFAAFCQLIQSLREYGGFRGGGAMCSAIVLRAKIAMATGQEDLPFEAAVAKIMGFLSDVADRIGFLLDLLCTDLGKSRASLLTRELSRLFASTQSIRDFLPTDRDMITVQDITESFERRLFGGGIPRDLAEKFMVRLESMAEATDALPSRQCHEMRRLMTDRTGDVVDGATTHPRVADSGMVRRLERERFVRFVYRGEQFVFRGSAQQFVLGRGPTCDIVVDYEGTSRAHAVISMAGGRFRLLDQSRNGTYVAIENDAPVVIKNEDIELRGSGSFYLGADPAKHNCLRDSVIRFECVDI